MLVVVLLWSIPKLTRRTESRFDETYCSLKGFHTNRTTSGHVIIVIVIVGLWLRHVLFVVVDGLFVERGVFELN